MLGYLLYFILALILFLTGIILVFLLLPIRYRVRAQYDENDQALSLQVGGGNIYTFTYSYRFNQAQSNIRFLGLSWNLKKSEDKKERSPQRDKSKKPASKAGKSRMDFRLFLNKKLGKLFLELLADLLQHLRPKYLNFYATIGFEEPNHTGYLMGAINFLMHLTAHFDIRINPVWDEAYCEIDLETGGRIIPAYLIYRILRFMVSKLGRTFIYELYKSGKRKNKFSPGAAQER